MKHKNLILYVLCFGLVIGLVFTIHSKNMHAAATKTLISHDLDRVVLLANQNKSYLDAFFKGDDMAKERLLYNHMTLYDTFIELESLKILDVDSATIRRSVEVLDAKTYIDRLSIDDEYDGDVLTTYYDRLVRETDSVKKEDTTLQDVARFLESGNTNFQAE